MKRRRQANPKLIASNGAPSELPTFLEHVYELRKRLFWVVAVVLVASSAAYPFLDKIISVLTAPLGNQQLYYLTPIGGLSFSIKICIYIGIMVAVPILMYHLYRYLEPLMGKWRKSAVFYVGLSSTFAIIGVLFAYFVSLPGALHFLTGLNIEHIQAMLTVDSYLSFVVTYLLGAAILFQIPLLLLIINTMTPLKPSKLMKIQRFVILGAFIVAAVISPTPDIMNQTMFALPIILMYQIGVLLVWLQNSSRARRQRKADSAAANAQPVFRMPVVAPPAVVNTMTPQVPRPTAIHATPIPKPLPAAPAQRKYADIMAPRSRSLPVAPSAVRRTIPVPARAIRVPARSIDGFVPYRPAQVASSS
jgi:sec-independent protein translocase protein TatC